MTAPQLLYILSSGRSDSTLIDMVLGGNEGLVSVGEFHRLALYARESELCTCGTPVGDCPFWTEVARVAAEFFGEDEYPAQTLRRHEVMLRSDRIGRLRNLVQIGFLSSGLTPPWGLAAALIGREHARSIDNSWIYMQAIARVSGSRTVIESTKDVRRLKQYFLSAPDRVRVLHLTRDGRAVAASAIRRTGCSMTKAAGEWRRKNHRILVALRGIPASSICRLRYEDFCANPTAETARILNFLRQSSRTPSIELNKAERHNIGGNPMRFERKVTDITLDTRWHDQLSADDRKAFRAVAGQMNETMGYHGD